MATELNTPSAFCHRLHTDSLDTPLSVCVRVFGGVCVRVCVCVCIRWCVRACVYSVRERERERERKSACVRARGSAVLAIS